MKQNRKSKKYVQLDTLFEKLGYNRLSHRNGIALSVACGDSCSPSGTSVPPPPAGGVFPKVGAKNVAAKPLPLTLGEVALRSNDGEGG